MSKRLQLLIPDDEYAMLRDAAAARQMTVSEMVRAAVREAISSQSSRDVGARIAAIRSASRHSFPAPDIDQMLGEIEAGYLPRPE
jgi:hypothetical protein